MQPASLPRALRISPKEAHAQMMTAQLLLWKTRLEHRMRRRENATLRIERELEEAWDSLERLKETTERDADRGLFREVEQYFRGVQRSLHA